MEVFKVFTHTHAIKSGDEGGSTTYSWSDEDKATATHEKFQESRAQMLQGSRRENLTRDEENAIFDSIIDPTQRGRRYGNENQAASGSQKAYGQTQDQESVLARIAELEAENHRRAAEMAEMHQLMASYMQQGPFNSSGASGADDES